MLCTKSSRTVRHRACGQYQHPYSIVEVDQRSSDARSRNGRTVVQRQQPIEASAYQQSLDAGLEPPELTTSTVRYWSDFNRVFFHPRSIVQLNEYELNSSLVPFERWDTGEDLFSSLDKENDLLDRDIRPFAEEADQMQAIQIMTTVDDAWGGFASRYIERLRDEYGKTTIWTWGLQDAFPGLNRVCTPKSTSFSHARSVADNGTGKAASTTCEQGKEPDRDLQASFSTGSTGNTAALISPFPST